MRLAIDETLAMIILKAKFGFLFPIQTRYRFMANLAFFNGEYVQYDKLTINASDLSIHRGYSIFDYFVAENGIIIWLEDYLDRFYQSAQRAEMKVPYDREELKKIIFELVRRNNKAKSGVKLILTGGYSTNGYTPSGECNLLIFNLDFPHHEDNLHEKGVSLVMDEYMRPNPTIKTTNYFNSVLHRKRMEAIDAVDVLYYHQNIIYETSRSNIYLIKNGRVITKEDDVLQGVTRKNVLRVIEQNYPLELRDIPVEELWGADEVFITSSTKWILPVVRIEDRLINDGKVGRECKKLIDLYEQEVLREVEKIKASTLS